MKNTHSSIRYLGLLAALPISAHAAEITWDPAAVIAVPEDISNPPGAVVHEALDFNNATGVAAGDDQTINGIIFTTSVSAGSGNVATTMNSGPGYNATWFGTGTGDPDLDALLNSHSWLGANPGEITVTISNLTPGKEYQVQFIAVADSRACCAARTYEPDDGQGNYTTGVSMNRGSFSSTIGTFVADGATQTVLWRSLNGATGNNDPGFSGLVVLELADLDDDDSDGLTNSFEILYGLDPNDDDSDDNGTLDGDENTDGDNLTNLQEQTAGTNPNKADTDDDTLLDHVESNTGTWNGVNDTGTNPLLGDSDGDNLSDGVENPDLPFVDENQTGSDPNIADTDSDNLPDDVEVAINLNPNNDDTDGNGTLDGDEDTDSDSSTNSNELTVGTDPGNDDTDNDGYLDGNETNTGIWTSATDTGTNPLNDDTDGDGLKDGVENPDLPYVDANQTGSNPHRKDTDNDLASDGDEIAGNTDPTNPNDTPPLPRVQLIDGLLGGDLTDPENDGIDLEDTSGTNFNWVSIDSSSKAFFTDATAGGSNEGAFDVFDNKVGGGEAKWCCDAAPQDLTVEFENAVTISHFTMTSSNDTPGRDPTVWQIQGSNDGINFEVIFDHTEGSVWTARNQTALFVPDTAVGAYRFIRYAVTATGSANHALGEIEYFGTVGSSPLEITDITYLEDTDRISLTWTSRPGAEYTVFATSDLSAFDADVNDGVPSGGETTTYEFPNPAPGTARQFFKVVEN